MHGRISHLELGTRDTDRAVAFFTELLGWTFRPFEGGAGSTIDVPTVTGGLHGGVSLPNLMVHLEVDDIDAAVARVRELGGIATEPSPVEPGFGRFASCTDDQGCHFGLHQPDGGS